MRWTVDGLLIHTLRLRAQKKSRWVEPHCPSVCTCSAVCVVVWVHVVKHPCVVDGPLGRFGSETSVVWRIPPSALLCYGQTSLASSALLQLLDHRVEAAINSLALPGKSAT